MRRALRILGTLMIVGGVLTLAWAFVIWRWEDPVTSLYTAYEQRGLSSELDERFDMYAQRPEPASLDPAQIAADARRYRRETEMGHGFGRIEVPRLGLDMVLVYGTDTEPLKRGPGLDPRTFFPGQGRLVYVAGHRTTFGAPFSDIEEMRAGDLVRVEVPYATFTYTVTGNRIVDATDLSVLRTKNFEQIALQACHPRFFASQRWITYARLTKVEPPEAPS
jgi:sortase A